MDEVFVLMRNNYHNDCMGTIECALSELSLKSMARKSDVLSAVSSHVETVALLSRKPDMQVDLKIELDEFDITAAESKATYPEIKEYILKNFGLKVSSLNISQIKNECGLETRENFNKPHDKDYRQPKCPDDKRAAIIAALKNFKMI